MEAQLATRIVRGLRDAGIEFVSYLPETRLSEILPLLRDDPEVMLAPVANESEAVSIAAGAALGGRPAAVYKEAAFMSRRTICS
jgi:sulfopyruvate decarboxylase TPP-binding subunit